MKLFNKLCKINRVTVEELELTEECIPVSVYRHVITKTLDELRDNFCVEMEDIDRGVLETIFIKNLESLDWEDYQKCLNRGNYIKVRIPFNIGGFEVHTARDLEIYCKAVENLQKMR